MPTDSRLQARIDYWKTQLIDLTKRNRLLFLKPGSETNVHLVAPDIDELYSKLVIREQLLKFYRRSDEENLLDFDENGNAAKALATTAPLRHDEVRSDMADKPLWRKLYSLRQRARTSLNEQGVVTLYVAFGFLEWTEAATSDVSFWSPLILVPVEIIHESANSEYRLRFFDDEITVNPALSHVLTTQFALALPELPDAASLDLLAYFEQIGEAVKSQRKWSVIPEAHLGLFSFHKIAMWKDLRSYGDVALEQPLIRALAGDPSWIKPPPSDLPGDDRLDNAVSPEQTFQIMDADSSQQEAIQAAKQGVSFILQGPPGTGKSQTISNIVAECLSQGKKVLFVSEKMAALNVVHRRLSDHGLGEFCLQAHSHKANKKEIVQQLGWSLQPSRSPQRVSAVDFDAFQTARNRLNHYVTALHTVRQPLEKTAYQVHGELAACHYAPDLTFEFERPHSVTPVDLAAIDDALDDLVRLHDVAVNYTDHPWRGVRIQNYNPNQVKADIRAHFTELVSLLSDLQAQAPDLAAASGVDSPDSLVEVGALIDVASHLRATPRPPRTWFSSEALPPLIAAAQEYQRRFSDYRSRREALLRSYQPRIFELDFDDLAHRLTDKHDVLLRSMVAGLAGPQNAVIQNRAILGAGLQNVARLLVSLDRNLSLLAEACSLPRPGSLFGGSALCKTAGLLLNDPRPQTSWFNRSHLVELRAKALEAEERFAMYQQYRELITSRYEPAFLSFDHQSLITRFSTSYGSALRILKPGYHRDLGALRAELKTPATLSYQDAVRDLKSARATGEHKAWIDSNTTGLATEFGVHFDGLGTDWSKAIRALDACRVIVDHFGDRRVPESVCQLLIDPGQRMQSIRQYRDTVVKELNVLEGELGELRKILNVENASPSGRPVAEMDHREFCGWIQSIQASLVDFVEAWETVTATRRSDATDQQPPVFDLVKDVREAQALIKVERQIQDRAADLRRVYGWMVAGLETRWEDILSALDWTGKALALFAAAPPKGFIDVASGGGPAIDTVSSELQRTKLTTGELAKETAFLYGIFPALGENPAHRPFEQKGLDEAKAWVQRRLDRLGDLDRWMEFQKLRGTFQTLGLQSYLAVVLQRKPDAKVVKSAFYKRFWSVWLDELYASQPALAGFEVTKHEATIAKFRDLDRQQMTQAQQRIRALLLRGKPTVGTGAMVSGEISVLLKEVNKKARHRPIRKLITEIPNLLLALRPCLLMSPLSVATFLDPTVVEFDTVLFDEASQICPEDAVGAIMRGKQVIVVGDSKQLPPTRFFSAAATDDWDDDEAEEETANEVYESILDECATVGLPSWMLRWHYRSRCEALIAFSNHHLYEDRLVTFPGPVVTAKEDVPKCVQFIHVPDGLYVRGKAKDAGTNRIEAKKVAQLIFEHFASRPSQSLGVIAFSERQMTAIDDEVRHLRLAKPEFEPFFSEEGEEPFFIKNLENVQGDERDVILFSVGYASDQSGKPLSMNFGPLNREGGERRLNVAVTRAKDQVLLVSSILPQDIELSRTQAKGVRLLKEYMQFARQGPSALLGWITVPDGPQFDSIFEEQVFEALRDRGYTVHTQVGCAGYRIDLAIVDDAHPGQYLLAIECDGASYHSSKTARDRDRLRHQVLESMGWRGRIIRVWSSDWVRDRERQMDRLQSAIDRAAFLVAESTTRTDCCGPATADELAVVTDLRDVDDDAATPEVNDTPEDGTSVVQSAVERLPSTMREEIHPYREFAPSRLGSPDDFYTIAEYRPEIIADVLSHVVKVEGPIHITAATRKVVACWGMGRAGSNLLFAVKSAAERLHRQRAIVLRGDFLWPTDVTTAVVRVPEGGAQPRPVEMVPLEEVAEACYLCVKQAYGITVDALVTETARLLGYNRTGERVRARIEEAVELCASQGRVVIRQGSVRLA